MIVRRGKREYDSLFGENAIYKISRPGLCWHAVCKRLNLDLKLSRRLAVCTTARIPAHIAAYIAARITARITARIRIVGNGSAKGEVIDSLTVRCFDGPTLSLDPTSGGGRDDSTGSRSITEVKHDGARIAERWVTVFPWCVLLLGPHRVGPLRLRTYIIRDLKAYYTT